jgi:hypothetical protein
MSKQIITMKIRFDYLRNIFEEQSGITLSFPEFMECLFSKLENEIREGSSNLSNYYEEGEGDKLPIRKKRTDFEYDYEK